ncbi:MAG: Prochlorococcus phage [Actinomycetota bacterium]|jgi:hypothetical protein
MALNPFFLQGSANEQRLIQELINEQLKIYGVEVIYIPRKFVRKETILKEISSSKFDDNYAIEAYINNYDGYTGQGDILTKFGVNLKDELSLVISRERFEDFISPFLDETSSEIELSTRPREGDLIYFPLGQRLFEVKFVEHENPFYQLGKLYVYELKCELFEYEDEVIDTSIEEIDTQIQEEGHIATLNLIAIGSTATATATIGTGYVRKIYLNDDGYGYTSSPVVSISTAPPGGINASAVAITTSTSSGVVRSVKEILLINAGSGYTVAPKITITGGGGAGAAATCSIETVNNGIISFSVTNGGQGYRTKPTITINGLVGAGQTAVGVASLSTNNQVASIRISNPGVGYTEPPSIVIAPPSIISGIGTFIFNEVVIGSTSGTQARVKSWDQDTKTLKVSFINSGGNGQGFYPGEIITGTASSSVYAISLYDKWNNYDKYNENKTIQEEGSQILDISEPSPFGFY